MPPSPLTPQQQAVATHVYQHLVQQGLPPARAREIVSAGFGESSLNPRAVGPPTRYGRAKGFLQLLSPGYVQRAQRLGGVFNVDANVDAILPDYASYWRTHPHAAPGEAAAAVEKSGEGADYYSAALGKLGFLGGGAPGSASPTGPPAPGAPQPTGQDPRTAFALSIAQGIGQHKPLDLIGLAEQINQLHAQQPADQAAATPETPAPTRGGYVFPIAGQGWKFNDDWGAARAGHTHAGIDIPAPEGTPLLAVTNGTVTAAGPSGAAGNRVWLNGRFFYAHLSRIAVKPGERVRAGQVIGYVGATGDATGPHLHFGWSPNASQGVSWANPYNLLRRLGR